MESAAILVVNSFESNSVGKGRWVTPKKQVLCFRLKRKALYLGCDPRDDREMRGVPWLRSCLVIKSGVEPSSMQRSVRLGWTRHIALPLLIWKGEAGGRTPQVQVSVPAPSSATTSPPPDHVINTCFTNTEISPQQSHFIWAEALFWIWFWGDVYDKQFGDLFYRRTIRTDIYGGYSNVHY